MLKSTDYVQSFDIKFIYLKSLNRVVRIGDAGGTSAGWDSAVPVAVGGAEDRWIALHDVAKVAHKLHGVQESKVHVFL